MCASKDSKFNLPFQKERKLAQAVTTMHAKKRNSALKFNDYTHQFSILPCNKKRIELTLQNHNAQQTVRIKHIIFSFLIYNWK